MGGFAKEDCEIWLKASLLLNFSPCDQNCYFYLY